MYHQSQLYFNYLFKIISFQTRTNRLAKKKNFAIVSNNNFAIVKVRNIEKHNTIPPKVNRE